MKSVEDTLAALARGAVLAVERFDGGTRAWIDGAETLVSSAVLADLVSRGVIVPNDDALLEHDTQTFRLATMEGL